MSVTVMQTPLQKWQAAVAASVTAPSQRLNEVTGAFQTYEGDKSQANLTDLAAKFQLWRTTGNLRERAELVNASHNLELFIAAAEKANRVIVTRARDIGTNRFYDLVKPVPTTIINECVGPISPDRELPPLVPSEVQKINEAFARAQFAAVAARDALTGVSPKLVTGRTIGGQAINTSGRTPGASPTMTTYTKFFGAWDQARFTKVLTGFEAICDGFDAKVQLYDIRNANNGPLWFAACYPGQISRDHNRRATSQVRMVMGRVFFIDSVPRRSAGGAFNAQAAFTATSDATAGTFVHELAHGTFMAIDAPIVDARGNWTLAPISMVPGNPDYGQSPDATNNQSATPANDALLASFFPDIAILNADNYGQFAREVAGWST
jgi:hypothetical protein